MILKRDGVRSGSVSPARGKRDRHDFTLVILFLLCFAFIAMTPVWDQLRGYDDHLPISIHSIREADYSADPDGNLIGAINLGILGDILRDQGAGSTDYDNRMATITAVLLSPVPSATGTLTNQFPPTATPIVVASSTSPSQPTQPPIPSSIPPSATSKPPPPPQPSIRLLKSLSSYTDNDHSGSITLGDDLLYRFTVTNNGNTSLSLVGAAEVTFSLPVSCPQSSLAAGSSMICTTSVTHRVTLAEANAGSVVNQASAWGDYGGVHYVDLDTLTTSVARNPSIQLVKRVDSIDDNDSSSSITEGDGLWYQFDLTNAGNVSLSGITVTDNTFSLTVNCPATTLTPGGTITCSAASSHILSAAEISSGEISNTATAKASFGSTTVQDVDTLVTPLGIQLTKSLKAYDDNDSSGSITLGDDLWYEFTVTNIGSSNLNSVSVVDDTFSITVGCPSSTLSSGASMTCDAVSAHRVTLAEANAGLVHNSAHVTAQTPSSTTVTDVDSFDTAVERNGALGIVTAVNPTSFNSAGQTLNFSVQVTNTGNVTISGPITLSMDIASDESCPLGNLAPGNSITCTASYVASQADLDSGSVTSISSATGTDPGGATITSNIDNKNVPAVQNPSIQIQKFASSYIDNDSSSSVTYGDDLSYTFDVTNNGNVTMGSLGVTEDSFGLTVNCPGSTLAPSAFMTCSTASTHTITLAEADAGQVVNTASAAGLFDGAPHSDSDTISTTVMQDPSVALSISADVSSFSTVGQNITYTFTITNTGNVSLPGPFTVTDDRVGTLTNCASGPIAPAGFTTCTAVTAVTQTDLDAGSITNTATASDGTALSSPDSLTINASQSPALSLTKSVSPSTYSAVGQVLTYTYTIQNSGNVTLSGPFSISDDKIGTVSPCGSGPLVPTATTSCTATYVAVQFDLDFGSVTNTATASTTYNSSPVVSNSDSATANAIVTASYTINKTATDVGGEGPSGHADAAGDVITYQITLFNNGNVSLVGVNVSDPMLGTLTGPNESGLNDGVLSVGETWTYTGTYTVTQTDIDNNGGGDGDIDNTASATTTFLPTPKTASASVPVDQIHELTVDKTSTTTQVTSAGQVVDYSYLLTNTGNQPLTGISLSDDNTDAAPVCSATSLAVSATTTCSAQHTVSQSEMDAGGNLVNNATASSTEAPNAIDSLSIPIVQSPSIQIVKSLDSYTDNDVSWSITRGDGLLYAFSLTNTGNVTLDNVQVTDDTFAISVTCPSTSLAPSAFMRCTADAAHTITLDESSAGKVVNSATASGEAATVPYTDSDTLITTVETPPASVVSGQVRDDSDADGDLGDSDAGLANVKVELDTGSCTLGSTCPFTVTDANGVFSFNSVGDGSYQLVETDPANYYSTADSDPPNDNRIDVIVLGGVSSTNNIFLNTVNSAVCSPPHPTNGFVVSTSPANGATGVALSTTTITVTFNQPMLTSGADSVLKIGKYELENQNNGRDVDITMVTYDPVTFTATLTIDTADPDWVGGVLYELTIKNIKNACGDGQSGVIRSFTTELVISGSVLNNVDGEGIYGSTITLTGVSCGGTCGTTSTDLNGNFEFAGFAPGSYTLTQTNLPGYTSVSDSSPPNDDQIPLTLSAGSNSTGHLFTDTPTCTGGANFVASTNPANGATGVSLSTTTLTVTFNQPMITTGGGSVLDKGNYDNNIDNETLGGDVPILSVSYDPVTYKATLTIDTTDPQWKPGSQFRLRIKNGIKNACGNSPSGSDVDVFFTTNLVISGQVRNDTDNDGDLNDPDSGISGVTVRLYNATNNLIGTTTTNSGGYFTFSSLSPGTYYIRETDLSGFVSTADSFGANDNEITVVLTAGANSIGHKFLDHSSLPVMSIANYSHFEKNSGVSTYQFDVTLSTASASTVTANYTTTNGTATGGANCSASVDYRNNSGVVTFSPGATSQKINVTVCADTDAEPDETFTVNLSGPANAVLGQSTGTGTIFDDDSAGFTSGDFVKSISPPNNSTNVSVNTSVVVEFNRPMCESTLTSATNTRLISGSDVSLTRSYDPSTWTLTMIPDAPLASSTTYQVMIRFTKSTVDGCNFSPSTHTESFSTSP